MNKKILIKRNIVLLFLFFFYFLPLFSQSNENNSNTTIIIEKKTSTKEDILKDKENMETIEGEFESKILNILPPQDILYFRYIYQPHNRLIQEPGKFDLHEYNVGFRPSFELNENLFLGIGIDYVGYDFRFDIEDVEERRSLHALTFPMDITGIINDEWLISIQVIPGFFTDFRGLNKDDFQVNGGVIVGYLFRENLLGQIGVFATNDFGEIIAIPVGGIIWKPTDYLDINILIPFSAKISYNFTIQNPKDCNIFAYYELDGNEYHFRYRKDGDVIEDDGQFTFYRIGLGIEYFIRKGVSLKLIIGGTTEGKYDFREKGINDDGRMAGTFFLLVGFSFDQNFFLDILKK